MSPVQVSFVATSLSGIGGAYSAELDAYAAAINGSTAGPPAPALGHRHYFIGDYAVMTQPTWMSSLRMQVRHGLTKGNANLLHGGIALLPLRFVQSSRTLRSECVNDEGILVRAKRH